MEESTRPRHEHVTRYHVRRHNLPGHKKTTKFETIGQWNSVFLTLEAD